MKPRVELKDNQPTNGNTVVNTVFIGYYLKLFQMVPEELNSEWSIIENL